MRILRLRTASGRATIAVDDPAPVAPQAEEDEGASDAFVWTDFPIMLDTQRVYVSSSTGSDSNDGLSVENAKATIAAGYAVLRTGYPDQLLLKRGDTFSTGLGHWKKSGRSASEKMVISSYGSATARPILESSTSNGFTREGGSGSPLRIDFIGIAGLDFYANGRTASNGASGFWWLGPGDEVLVEDCRFRGYAGGVTVQKDANGPPTNFSFRRCLMLDSFADPSHSQGAFCHGVEGLTFEECVLDHNGWKEGEIEADIYSHNMYLTTSNTNVSVISCLTARASSHGMQVRPGGTITGNIAVRCPLGILLGGGDPLAISHTNGVTGTVTNNVILEGTDITEALPRGNGIELANIGLSGAIVSGNIIANKVSTDRVQAGIHLNGNSYGSGVGINNVTGSGNIVYEWGRGLNITAAAGSPPSPSAFSTVGGNAFDENSFQDPSIASPGRLVTLATAASCTFLDNIYDSTRDSEDQFSHAGVALSLSEWNAASGDTGTENAVSYPAPTRSLATYNATIGGEETNEAFLTAIRSQSRYEWNESYAIPTVRTYLRAGFGL